MSYPDNQGTKRSAIVVAIIGALGVIVAAVITAVIGLANHSSGVSDNSAAAPRTSPAANQQAGSPKLSQPSASAPATGQTAPSVAASPPVSALPIQVPVLKPTDDPGFSPVWHGTFTVMAGGVHITTSGVLPATPQDWDMAYQYQPGDASSGWQSNVNNSDSGATFAFDGTGAPDPAWCQRAYAGGDLPMTTVANVGDRDCYADDNGIVGYLQVTSVGSDGPTVVAWFWKGPPPSA